MAAKGGGEEPVEIRVGKPRLLNAYDFVVGKAVAEAAMEELARLFREGRRRRLFRLVNGTPADGGIVIESAIHDLALGEPRENAAMLTFVVVLQASRRRRPFQSGRAEAHASIDVASNPVPQAVRIMRDCIEHQVGWFADVCENEIARGR